MEASRELWRLRFDPMQVHNFLDWEVHLETIRRMKAKGACATWASRPRTAGGTISQSTSCADCERG
jgi:hypothetical protein